VLSVVRDYNPVFEDLCRLLLNTRPDFQWQKAITQHLQSIAQQLQTA
jgi:hypothetical protein